MNKASLKSYLASGGNKYNFQYGDYITNGFSLLKINTELEKSTKLLKQLDNIYNNFYYNYKNQYSLKINELNIDLLKDIKINNDLLNIDKKFKNNMNYCINIKELKKIIKLVKIDAISIKTSFCFNEYSIVISLIKNNDVIGFLLPCRVY